MQRIDELINETHPFRKPFKARHCSSFFCRLRGLMFTPSIGQHEGLLMVQNTQDRINAAIHMFFMNYDLAVIWLNRELKVVDVQLARRWRPAYTPAQPALYVLETHPDRLKDFHIGDQVTLKKCVD
jgi:uncharacterized membrane protein (UPF0127 family)